MLESLLIAYLSVVVFLAVAGTIWDMVDSFREPPEDRQ